MDLRINKTFPILPSSVLDIVVVGATTTDTVGVAWRGLESRLLTKKEN